MTYDRDDQVVKAKGNYKGLVFYKDLITPENNNYFKRNKLSTPTANNNFFQPSYTVDKRAVTKLGRDQRLQTLQRDMFRDNFL